MSFTLSGTRDLRVPSKRQRSKDLLPDLVPSKTAHSGRFFPNDTNRDFVRLRDDFGRDRDAVVREEGEEERDARDGETDLGGDVLQKKYA